MGRASRRRALHRRAGLGDEIQDPHAARIHPDQHEFSHAGRGCGGAGVSVRIEHGDSRDVLKTLDDCSVDSVVTDPPYALVSIQKRFGKPGSAPAQDRDGLYKRASAGFMGQQWDTGEVAFDPEFWAEVLRVLRPGGHLLAFGGTRSYHRLACAIEDAGFEIRDQIGRLYGSGFPKSHNPGRQILKALENELATQGVEGEIQWK